MPKRDAADGTQKDFEKTFVEHFLLKAHKPRLRIDISF